MITEMSLSANKKNQGLPFSKGNTDTKKYFEIFMKQEGW